MAQIPAEITDMRVVGALAPQSGDTQPPTIPQNLLATAINAGRIDLSWTASTDDIGVSGYQIFRGATPLNTTAGTTYSDTTCQPSTLYSYTVVAFDVAGNSSAASTAATATTPANAAPSWSSVPAQTLIVGNSYSLNLNTYCTDADLDTLTFTITAGTLPTGLALVGSIISGTPTTAGQTPTITVQAADQFHQISTTIAYHSYTTDITAPPVPTGLSASAISTSQINLSWAASTDVAGSGNEFVAGTQDYRLYRSTDGVTYSLRTTILVGTTSYSDTGLGSSTQYFYKITARDSALNESAQSSSVNATTQAVASGFDFYISPTGSDSNPGTQAQPWAITALNTKRATYSPSGIGKTIGLLDGTYNISSLMSANRDIPALDIEGGTAGHPVIIQSVNVRGATITAKSGSVYGGATNTLNAMIGHTPSRRQGYITFDGLKVTGGRTNVIEMGTYAATISAPGISIQNCEIYDCSDVGSSPGGGNPAAITINSNVNGTTITNNYIHDIIGHNGTTDGDHLASILVWQSVDHTIANNTIISAGPIYGKEDTQGGLICSNNYIDNSIHTNGIGVQDFMSPPTPSTRGVSKFFNNIIIAGQPLSLYPTLDTTSAPSEAIEIYNNTILIRPFAAAGGIISQHDASSFKCYNNIIVLSGGANPSDLGFMLIRDSAITVMDYNLYPASNQKWSWFSPDPGSRTGTTSLATWKSHFSCDAHSPTPTDTPGFIGVGARALFYNVTAGAAFGAGRIGGVSGGAACNIGAWDGTVTQIGCNF